MCTDGRSGSPSKGRVIDDCVVDDVTNHMLKRQTDVPDGIRIELTMNDAISTYDRIGADVEVYSQPRVIHAAAGFDKEKETRP